MHHEVLLALSGHPGDIIRRSASSRGKDPRPEGGELMTLETASTDAWACCIDPSQWSGDDDSTDGGTKLLSKPEVDVINRTVGPLSARYSELLSFVRGTLFPGGDSAGSGPSLSRPGGDPVSLYKRALCAAISQVLQEYRAGLCKVEQEVLRDPAMPLTALLGSVMRAGNGAAECLPVLCEMVREVKSSSLRGGQILNAVHTLMQSRAGLPRVKACLERVLDALHHVMYGLLESWMIHGLLVDANEEFFVKRNVYCVQVYDPSCGVAPASAAAADQSLQADFEWHNEFCLDLSMFPSSYVKLSVAEQILFIGKAVRVLHHPSTGKYADDAKLNILVKELAAAMSKLKSEATFRSMHLEACVDGMHTAVAERLWRLVVVDANLVSHLKFIRRFFLLGKGEFFRCFIDSSRKLMSEPPEMNLSRSETAVNLGPWKHAAVLCGLDDDATAYENVSLSASSSNVKEFAGLRLRLLNLSFCLKKFSAAESGGLSAEYAAGASADELVLVGSCLPVALKGAAGRLSLLCPLAGRRAAITSTNALMPSAGGVWYRRKLPVDHGFDTSFSVDLGASDNAARPHGIAFVVQHDCNTALGQPGVGLGFSGIRNSLAVALRLPIFDEIRRVRVESQISVQCAGRDRCNSYGPSAALCSAPVSGDLLCGTVSLRVKYALEGGESIGERPRMVFRVSVNGDEVLAEPLDLGELLALERGSGRAWVGIVAGGSARAPRVVSLRSKDKSAEERAEAIRKSKIFLSRWEFESTPRTRDFQYAWSSLISLDASPPRWPLHLIIDQSSIDLYGTMFQYLLTVKRVSSELKDAWAVLNQKRFRLKKTQQKVRRRLMLMWRLRASMAYLLESLQYHLQVDVIDTLFVQLCAEVEKARDFEAVYSAHREFVSGLIERSFLHNKVVRSSLETVLQRCLRFCSLVHSFAEAPATLTEEALDAKLRTVARSFSHDASFLFALLMRMNSRLLLRVDFNDFFSELARGQHSYVERARS